MRKLHCSSINRKLSENEKAFINRNEYNYQAQIEMVANSIADSHKTKPIILLSGPSGAGKTTSALRLEEHFNNRGIKTHTISMDDYFHPISDNDEAMDENGEIDFESPYRLDIPLLNQHIIKLANKEEIILPRFDFKNQVRNEGKPLKRESGEIIIFEGIHALNPEVTGLTNGFANFIYVSVRTRIESKSGILLHPSHIRLMRRLIRDKFFRARKPEDTLNMFKSVEAGVNKYIAPFKSRAEYSIDTFIPYELSVYKNFLFDDLKGIADKYSEFEDFDLMLEVLDQLCGVDLDSVPEDSLVREFTGGSRLSY